MHQILSKFSSGLLVSCQPVDGGPLDRPDIVACFARAVLAGGASGLRIEGAENLKAVRAATEVPIIGLIKSDRNDTDVRITSTLEDIDALAEAGADIIAVDATDRKRPVALEGLVERVRFHKKLVMADCSNASEGNEAARLNCDVLGTTMSGYIGTEIPSDPDLDLVNALSKLNRFVIAEGRYNRPSLANQAILAGANAVVVGSAITRPEHITSWFADSIQSAILQIENRQ